MVHCEGHARARLQIALERHRTGLVPELHDDVDDPWPAGGGVRTLARVVGVQSRRKIRRQPGVIAAWIPGTLKNVDDALGSHVGLAVQRSRRRRYGRSAQSRLHAWGRSAIPAMRKSREEGRFCERGGWLARPPSRLRRYGGQPSRGLPTVAHALLGKRERRLVAQIFPRWNPLTSWMRQIEAFQRAA
jgi:hypothetical protein